MADNTDEEHLDNPTNTQLKNPSDKIISTANTETNISNQEIENMEVHKHPHHVTHTKKWGEYLLEFLMLFLAVFLGFVAENVREHRVEQEEEREYIHSLINDLKADTALLSSNINFFNKMLIQQDSVLESLNKLDKGFNKTFFNNFSSFDFFPDFIYSDATIQQLKYSGGFRLIKKQNAIDSIMSYDSQVRASVVNDTYLNDKLYKLEDFKGEILNSQELHKQINQFNRTADQLEAEKFDCLITHDKTVMAKFYNLLHNYSHLCKAVKKTDMDLNKKATNLIAFLKKEYDLE